MPVHVVTERDAWSAGLQAMGGHDFSHTFDFHQMAQRAGEGEPIAFIAHAPDGGATAFWPVLKRPIPATEAFDFSSVYGYAGPLVRAHNEAASALAAIRDAMAATGAVSLFSRMHPLFAERLPESYRGAKLSEVVVIEVDGNDDVTRNYRGSHRREVVNAARQGVEVVLGTGAEAAVQFNAIYHEAMAERRAGDYYFFDLEYIQTLLNSQDFDASIYFAVHEGRQISAAIFIVTGDIMQYYLSGTLRAYRRLAPSKAIIAEAHRRAGALGVKRLLLGGGVGANQDALFDFKKGFSPTTAPYAVTRLVFDEDRFLALSRARGVEPQTGGFFPAYRAPIASAA